MNRKERLQYILDKELILHHLRIRDESSNHRGREGQESHFNIVIVSDTFVNMSRVARQRKVNTIVADEFGKGLHALTLKLLTCEEWNKAENRDDFISPICVHGH